MEENQNKEVQMNNSTESNIPNVSVEETAKKVAEKRENNKKLRIILFSIVGAIAVLVGLFLLFSHFAGMKTYTYNEEHAMYQYFSGVKSEYSGKVTLTNDGSITTVETKDGIADIKDAPIYFKDVEDKALITKSMQLMIPRLFNKNYKLMYFTELFYEKDSNTVYYMNRKEKVYLEDSFLYDGDNLYLFLTGVKLVVDKEEYELSSLSYAIVNYKDQVEIYDKLNDKYHIIETSENDVIATMGEYSINLSTDMISQGDNSRLLMKSIDALETYKKDEN